MQAVFSIVIPGEMTAECIVIENGTELPQSCEISVCANDNQYITDWHLSGGEALSERSAADSRVIKINGQDGVSIPHHILKKGLICYGTADLSLISCAKDVLL